MAELLSILGEKPADSDDYPAFTPKPAVTANKAGADDPDIDIPFW